MSLPAPSSRAAAAFWNWMGVIAPAVALVLPLLAGSLFGAFDNFYATKPVTFLSALCLVGAMLFPCAAFFYARDQWYRAMARASRSWPTADGVVEQSDIESKSTVFGTLYRLSLNVRYKVNGVDYEGDTAEFGPFWIRKRELIETLAKKYPAGGKVAVHYDPDDPETSTLETSDAMAGKDAWLIAIFIAAPFAFAILAAIKNAR